MASLSERLRTICDDALGVLDDGPGRRRVSAVRSKLESPLRITVAGGASSGKSTLVNALLGQKIAAVDAGECTRVVSEFRYDAHERVEVVGHDGSHLTKALERGQLPESLGIAPDAISHLVVHLSNANLERVTIVDTPGLNTVTDVNEAATADFLGVGAGKEATDTATAIGRADALIFLMPYLREADASVLAGFRSLYDGTGLSTLNAIAVLSKIDRLTPTGDPVQVAKPIAERVAVELRDVVSDVIPIIGLLAESSRAAVFTEDDARAVEELAAIEDEFDREDMLLTAQDFLNFSGISLSNATRHRLLTLLDMHGLRIAIAALDAGGRGASAILRALDTASGFAPLARLIDERFGRQAELLKAHAALCDLRRISYRADDDPDNLLALRSLRAPLERIELDPELHRLRVLEVMMATSHGALALPNDTGSELERLATGRDPAACLDASAADAIKAAVRGATRWGVWSHDPRRSPAQRQAGRVVKEAYELLWHELSRSGSAS